MFRSDLHHTLLGQRLEYRAFLAAVWWRGVVDHGSQAGKVHGPSI
ncbi:MAG TPA: hypothetical protein VGR73_02620 [Bryobacteraceae bacterium]|nr:hypothetical protein [Bryobacteraceae bacterium]